MVALDLNTGVDTLGEYINVPCTLARYIAAINSLNKSAYVYGVVYLPDPNCEEYAAFVKDGLEGV
jgi:hypothetical protein